MTASHTCCRSMNRYRAAARRGRARATLDVAETRAPHRDNISVIDNHSQCKCDLFSVIGGTSATTAPRQSSAMLVLVARRLSRLRALVGIGRYVTAGFSDAPRSLAVRTSVADATAWIDAAVAPLTAETIDL